MVSLLNPKRGNPLTSPSGGSKKVKTTARILNKLPVLPEAASEALRALKDPACSLEKLAAVIERDPSLAVALIRGANSPKYRIGRTVSTIRLAIERMGLEESRRVISTLALRGLEQNVSMVPKQWWKDLWYHSFLTACLCRRLSDAVDVNCQGEEFVCGLVHDIGRLLLAIGSPKTFEAVAYLDYLEAPEILIHERRATGSNHGYLGGWFANVMQLPASLSNACQFHHSPGDALEHQQLVALVAVADHMANYVHRERRIEGYVPDTSPGWPWLVLSMDEVTRSKCLTLLPAVMAAAVQEAREAFVYLS